MVWIIDFDSAAKKQLKKLPRHIQSCLLDYLENEIAPLVDARSRGKALTSHLTGLWRYRVQDYRMVCRIEDNQLRILVLKLGHRSIIYD